MSSHSFSAHPQDGQNPGAANITGHISALSDPGALDTLFRRNGNDIWAGKMPTVHAMPKSTGVMGAVEMLHDAQQIRGDILRKVFFSIIVVTLAVAAGVGYCLNIGLSNITMPPAHAGQQNIFNPIQQPKEEAYGLLGVQGTQTSSNKLDVMDAIGSDADIRPVEMAGAGNDPFAPVLKKEESEIYFSGVVDDPVHKRKIAIIKVRNNDPDIASAFITVVKRANETFTVADRKMSIHSITNKSVSVTVDGVPMTLPLDTFSTMDSSQAPNGVTTGLTPLNDTTGNTPDGMNPVSDSVVNSITSAVSGKSSSIIKLQE